MERQSKKPRSPRKGKPYSIRARMIFLGVLVLGVGFGALVAKLYQLQIVRGNELKTAANAQQVKDTVLEPLRGSILDSQGRVLADGKPPQVFSQVEALRAHALSVPATTELMYRLDHQGFSLPLGALSVDACADAVAAALGYAAR